LFSEKESSPPIYSALTTGFRNRIRFAFVNKSEKTQEAQQALVPQFQIEKWPTLLIVTRGGETIYYQGKMKLELLNEWAEKFTLPVGEERSEIVIGNKAHKAVSDSVARTYSVIHSYE